MRILRLRFGVGLRFGLEGAHGAWLALGANHTVKAKHGKALRTHHNTLVHRQFLGRNDNNFTTSGTGLFHISIIFIANITRKHEVGKF